MPVDRKKIAQHDMRHFVPAHSSDVLHCLLSPFLSERDARYLLRALHVLSLVLNPHLIAILLVSGSAWLSHAYHLQES